MTDTEIWTWDDVEWVPEGSAPTPAWRSYHGGNRRDAGGSLSRFRGTSSHARRDEAALPASHPAMAENRSLFPRSVVDAAASPRVLVSGINAAKIGRVVQKGPWRGLPIFTVTLEERATCPTSCTLLAECYGNAMPFARRHRPGAELEHAIDREMQVLLARHLRGIAVRLHVLGDFPDIEYVAAWAQWMEQHSRLHVFGFTAHPVDSQLGRVIAAAGRMWPDRWSVRFSVAADAPVAVNQATTIWRKPIEAQVPEGLVCPMQQNRTTACATCGLCWAPAAAAKRIVFIGHGMRRRSGAGKQ